jgi:diguanylate cyclase (GGDEF)-like protein/hemerythrin-like metal-binding protein
MQNAFERRELHDQLTGLANRELFLDRMSLELARMRRHKIGFALMMLYLDEFEGEIDANGHPVRDMVLSDVAKLLISTVRDIDTVARLAGCEFAILLDSINRKQDAVLITNKIIRLLSEPIKLGDGTHVKIGASIGIALSPQDGDRTEQLMSCVEQAIDAAKKDSKGQFRFINSLQPPSKKSEQPQPASSFGDISLGIFILDAQHMALANLIRGIIQSVTDGDKLFNIYKRVDRLVELCQIHFQTEEDLMKRHGVLGLEQYHAEHNRQLKKLQTLFSDLKFNRKNLATVAKELEDWLLGHIRGHDAEITVQLKSKGVP